MGFFRLFIFSPSAGSWLCCRAEVLQRNRGRWIAEGDEILRARTEGCGRALGDLWCYFVVCTFNSQSVFFPNGSECSGPCFGHSQDPLLCSCLKPGTSPASLWTNPGVRGGCSVLEDRVTPKTDRPQNCCGASGIFQLWVLCSREGFCVNP